MKRYEHILAYITSRPWAVLPEMLETIREVVTLRLDGAPLTEEDIADRVEMAQRDHGDRRGKRTQGGVAVIPVYGLLTPRADLMSEMSGATSMEAIRRDLRAAMADEEVASIVLDVDSPGGLAEGVPETAAELRKAREQKPIVAVANTMMASAAYYLASQASEVVASPSSYVGSVGVLSYHQDLSAAYEQKGIKTTLVKAGKYKGEANEFEPYGEEAHAHQQAIIDGLYDMFVSDVAKGRGVRKPAIAGGEAFGGGRVFLASSAMEMGLVDRIGTLDDTIMRVLKSPPATGRAKALAQGDVHNLEAEARAALVDGVYRSMAAELEAAIMTPDEAREAAGLPARDFEFERELYELRGR